MHSLIETLAKSYVMFHNNNMKEAYVGPSNFPHEGVEHGVVAYVAGENLELGSFSLKDDILESCTGLVALWLEDKEDLTKFYLEHEELDIYNLFWKDLQDLNDFKPLLKELYNNHFLKQGFVHTQNQELNSMVVAATIYKSL